MEFSKNIRHEIHENDGSPRQQPIRQVYDLDRHRWRHVFVKQQLKIATLQPVLIKPLRPLRDAQSGIDVLTNRLRRVDTQSSGNRDISILEPPELKQALKQQAGRLMAIAQQ